MIKKIANIAREVKNCIEISIISTLEEVKIFVL